MLTQSQIIQFEVFGFVVLEGVFTSDELRTITSEFDLGLAWATANTERRGIRKQFNWSNLGPDTPFLASLLEDTRFLGSAEQLLGRDVIGRTCNSNSFDGDRTEWHPDADNPARRGLKFASYLQPLDEKTGALRLISGSHKEPLHSDIKRIAFKESNKGVVDEGGLDVDEMPAYVARSEPGDVVAFDSRIWHASWGGGVDRRMCSVNYFAAPKTPEEEASMDEIKAAEAGLVKSFPLIERPQHWIANPDGSPIRQRWIDFLRHWGFIAANGGATKLAAKAAGHSRDPSADAKP
jgi:hypothetical protein